QQERIIWDADARRLWHEVYSELSAPKPGLFGAVVARGEAQVVRLAMIYALLDCSKVIHRNHLEAALALWKYFEDSAKYIFVNSVGDPVADEILRSLRANPEFGLTRTEIRNHFAKHKSAAEIGKALRFLQERALARCEKEGTPGRSIERWFICGAT